MVEASELLVDLVVVSVFVEMVVSFDGAIVGCLFGQCFEQS